MADLSEKEIAELRRRWAAARRFPIGLAVTPPRDLATVLVRWGRLSLVFEPRDLLILRWGRDAVTAGAACVQVRWARK